LNPFSSAKRMLLAQRKQLLKIVGILLAQVLLLNGCTQKLRRELPISPHPEDRPFQELSLDLSQYTSVQLRSGQDPNLALAVAASGGGYRAANFAAGALLGLEQIKQKTNTKRNVLSEVDYFSTVSGGGFAVGAYIASLHDHYYFTGTKQDYSFAKAMEISSPQCPCKDTPPPAQKTDPCIRSHLQGLYSDFIQDFIEAILPLNKLGLSDRGQRFELAIDDDVLSYRWRTRKLKSLPDKDIFGPNNMGRNASLVLSDIFVPSRNSQDKPILPYWIANATVYENGAIFPFTPDQLRLYRIDGFKHRMTKHKFEPHKTSYKDFVWNMPLAVGVASSANFPFALPANTLTNKLDPNNPYLYLVDGGMADNLGVITAIRLMRNKNYPQVTRTALLIIDAYQGAISPFSSSDKAPSIAKTAVRTMEISLDSWRGRYREIVSTLCQSENIVPIYLSFDDLVGVDFEQLYKHGLTEEDKTELCSKKSIDCEKITPFDIVRSISMVSPAALTKKGLQYRLTSAQQNLLIAAGRYIVHSKEHLIRKSLGWE